VTVTAVGKTVGRLVISKDDVQPFHLAVGYIGYITLRAKCPFLEFPRFVWQPQSALAY
jgi:hypothetical protein